MPLDPIVSLAVGIAESPGSYAFFLGSGVSRDAGVPTGGEVFWETVGALYRLENDTEETPNEGALAAWLQEAGRAELNYSSILELLTPSQEDRRAYLARFFEGRELGEAHRRLAGLAAQGLIRVFITTNFDRLLEHALQEAGIEPVVVTSHADLERAPAREHVPCFVLKPHGDYLQQTIRNTRDELAALEPGMLEELQAVFNRYGIVVVGYSGSDEAIANCLRARRSRYSLYWLSRGDELGEPARSLVEANSGRVIIRPDAATFLTDLARRLSVYAAHPTGETPDLINAEVVNLLRRSDDVGLRELLKRVRRVLREVLRNCVLERRNSSSRADLVSFADELTPIIERYLAAVFPLIEHRSELWDEEVTAIATLATERLFDSGLVHWIEMPAGIAWYLANAAGGFALAVENYAAAGKLLGAPIDDKGETLGTRIPGSSGVELGQSVMQSREPSQKYYAPYFEFLVRMLTDSDFVRQRYPELAASKERSIKALNDFNVLATIYAAARRRQVSGTWTMYSQGGEEFTRRLRTNRALRARVAADALGMTLDDFEERAHTLLSQGAYTPAHYNGSDANLVIRP